MELVARRPIVRETNLATLRRNGFAPVVWLPLREHRGVLRSSDEIAARALALAALSAWASLDEADVASDVVARHVERSRLTDAMTIEEREVLAGPRGALRFDGASRCDRGGGEWNAHRPYFADAAWALAWVLGFAHEPDVLGEPPFPSIARELSRFVFRGGDVSPHDLARGREAIEVAPLEDLFVCAHQTVALAILRHPRVDVPRHCDAAAIEARRRALTWTLSPGEGWDDVDLAT